MAALNEICFGPFIIAQKEAVQFDGFDFTGLALEFTSADRFVSPIYELADRGMLTSFSSSLAKFFIHQNHLPCDVPTIGYFRRRVSTGLLIPLDEILLAVHRNFSSSRSPKLLIGELRALLPLKAFEQSLAQNLLNEVLSQAGFRTTIHSNHGRTLSLHLEWVPVPDIGVPSRCSVSMGFIEFKPQPDRTLGKGKWMKPRVDLLGNVFRSELGKICSGAPSEYLSSEGAKVLIERFAWKPISLLKRKQLEEAKIAFIRSHPNMHGDLSGLAKAMIEMGLYSEGTDRSRVRKFATKALRELGVGLS
jgi:hypothetical protein